MYPYHSAGIWHCQALSARRVRLQSVFRFKVLYYFKVCVILKVRRKINNMKEVKEGKVVTTIMSKAYQITVPSVIRRALALEPGDPVEIRMERGRAVLRRAETREEQVKRVFAELDEWRKGLSQETQAKIKQHAGWTADQYREYIDGLPENKAYRKEKYGIKD